MTRYNMANVSTHVFIFRFGLFCAIFSIVQGNSVTCCDSCQLETDYDGCCRCCSTPDWDSSSSKTYLEIEYVSRRGIGTIIDTDGRNDTLYYILSHNHGFLTSIPSNICQFPDIVEIDLSDNNIRNLMDLKCLEKVYSVNMAGNSIETVSNTTFIGMTELKIVDLASNSINKIEPLTLSQEDLQFNYVYLQHNQLTQVDVTNIILEKPFCKLNFSNNQVTEISNDIGWKVDESKVYGDGGYVDFSENDFSQFIDFESIGFPDITMLGKLISFGFDIRNSNWTCDCKMQPFLSLAEDVIKKIWRNYFDVTCSYPEHLKDQSIPELVKDNRLDVFICNVTCPKGCYCFDQPNQGRTFVNCSNRHLTSMIEDLPKGMLDLDFSFNDITSILQTDFLNRTLKLKINYNRIKQIPDQFFRSIAANSNFQQLDMEGNSEITSIPKSIQLVNPCKLFFSDLTIDCDCDSFWLKKWMQSPNFIKCGHNYTWTCSTSKGLIPLLQLTEDYLKCEVTNYLSLYIALALTILSLLIIGVASFLYIFRYEIFVLKRRITFRRNRICPDMKYDVYISVDEGNRQMLRWAVKELLLSLDNLGYRVFIPFRDSVPGDSHDDMIIENMSLCRTCIMITSRFQENQETQWTTKEWKYAWNFFKGSKDRNIIIVNFDYLKLKEIDAQSMKAFFRLRMVIGFSNHRHDIIDKIIERLGPPLRPRGLGLKNAKRKYIHRNPENQVIKTQHNAVEMTAIEEIKPMYTLENAKPKLFFQNGGHGYFPGDNSHFFTSIM